jgi:hypothetical protein
MGDAFVVMVAPRKAQLEAIARAVEEAPRHCAGTLPASHDVEWFISIYCSTHLASDLVKQ